MRSHRLFALIALSALFFMSRAESGFAQLSKAVALVKGEIVTSSGAPATDVSITTYKGSERVNTTKATSEGKFQVVLQPNTNYRVTFSSAQFAYHEENLSVPASDKYQEIKMHVALNALQIGSPYSFNNLVFEPKSSDISDNVMPDMEGIASALKHNPKLVINATVYPDETPTGKKAAAQNGLAASRRTALMSYFNSKNIPETNVTIEISNNVPTNGVFERVVSSDPVPAKGKKKKKPAATTTTTGRKVLVPQYAVITMNIGS